MSTSGQPQFRYTQTPSKVLHLRNLPWECTEEELIELCKPFGKIVNTKCNVGANRNQAFVEFGDLNQAISMVSYYASSSEPAQVRGKTVYIQYSNRHEIVNNKSPGDVPGNVLLVTIEGVEAGTLALTLFTWDYTNPYLPVNPTAIEGIVQPAVGADGKRKELESNVLLASIENMQYAVTVDVLHTVFSAFGTVQKIAIFEKNGQTQALVQYPDVNTAAVAREALEGHCIYDGGYCKLHLSYSRHTDLNVKAYSDKSRDYTIPDISLLAAQQASALPAAQPVWQNPQAGPMYPGNDFTAPGAGPAQYPGGQVAPWDPSMQAGRPPFVSAPSTYPGQSYAASSVSSYASAPMPSSSSPHTPTSQIPSPGASMGLSPGVQANLRPGGVSSPSHLQQGVSPNVRPGGASPPGQPAYYGQ
ncbi:polypyrimidine tract-binding protein like protein 1 [Quercus suber]|uniref:Polypyrimidine tract-binding protein like protein 1 n=1 Tax=Quercus suber TaxID=58331 RepID=A0AAW0J2I5_QUESU